MRFRVRIADQFQMGVADRPVIHWPAGSVEIVAEADLAATLVRLADEAPGCSLIVEVEE